MAVYYAIVANAAIAASVPLTKRYFHPLEIGAVLLFSCIFTQIIFTLSTLNLKWIELTDSLVSFWFLELFRIVGVPCLMVWFTVLLKRIRFHWGIYAPAVVLGSIGIACFDELCRKWGFFTYTYWNFWFSVIKWGISIIGVSLFYQWFRHDIAKKGGLA
ncbi:hypothetical protein [Paenibacillus hamazuiensis]|uniref:hypothetical protein n=1 Tax=Paenibacillus hamazuiensis TaxID=2936508 RepID=UPI00200E6996|nr:hypothetical protein [Paenibacillus hamazuiensis]